MTGLLYGRNARLTLARPRGGGADSYFTQEANAVEITELRVSFQITKSLGSEPNTCVIEVYNLADVSRTAIERRPLHVQLEAGYDGEYARIFTGDLRWGSSTHESVDWVTRLEVADGDRAYNHARVKRSFKAGVDKKTVLDDIAKSMGWKGLPKSLDDARELVEQFSSGVTLQGPSRVEMDRVLKSAGMSWSVQDGQLQILRSTDVRRDRAFVVSQDTGMIGVPVYGAPKKAGEAPILSVKMLLAPEVLPGGRIQLATKNKSINGFFRVERVVHTGDTDPRGEWQTEIDAKPL